MKNDLSCDFIESTDFVHNLNLWTRDNHNVLYITGVSGSGKSRLAQELKKLYNCKALSLDPICGYYLEKSYMFKTFKKNNYNKILESCPEAIDFLSQQFEPRYNYTFTLDIMKSFIEWFENNFLHNGKLYILEGYLLHEAMDIKWFKPRPLIVKITDYENVVIRREGRKYNDDLSKVTDKEIELGMKNTKYRECYDSYIEFVEKLK